MLRIKSGVFSIVVLFTVGLFTGPAAPRIWAASYIVNTTSDAGPGSLRQALLDANAGGGGDILFSGVSGTNFLLAPLPSLVTNINIVGPGAGSLAVSGNGSWRVFDVAAGATCIISGLTIRDGWVEPDEQGSGGGAIRNRGTLTVSGCVLLHNRSRFGETSTGPGGAIDSRGTLVLSGVTLSGNSSDGSGGAIYSEGSLSASDTQVLNNSANDGFGGGVACFGSSGFTNVILSANYEWDSWSGGGLYGEGEVLLTNCVVSGNYADTVGAGLGFRGDNLWVLNSTISGNWAGRLCGAIYADGSNLVMVNSSVSSNQASLYVGGIGVVSGTASLSNCVVSGNEAFQPGASGIENWSTLNLVNCTVSGNSPWPGVANSGTATAVNCTVAFNDGGVDNEGTFTALNTIFANNNGGANGYDFSGTLNSQGHNLIRSLTGTTIAGTATGNLYGVDPLLGALKNNGGPTWTHALLDGSPAIGAGTSVGAPAVDQRGVARPSDVVDIGAYERTLANTSNSISVAAQMFPPSCSAGCVTVPLSGLVGRTYSVQRAPTVLGPWVYLGSVTIGTNGVGSLSDTNAPAGSAFYRACYP